MEAVSHHLLQSDVMPFNLDAAYAASLGQWYE
jgi:hypothetical protein